MTLTPQMRAQLQRVNDPSGVLLFLLIDSDSLTAPVRVVRDTRNWTVGGVTYLALPIEVTLPQDVPKEVAKAQIEMDNVGRDMLAELEVLPVGEGLEVTLRVASRSAPELTEWEFAADMSKASANYGKIAISIGDDVAMRRPAVALRYDQDTAPGLFAG